MIARVLKKPREKSESHVLNLVRDFGADNTGRVNARDALNAIATRFRGSVVDNERSSLVIEIPPGKYLVDVSGGSVNWSNIVCYNTYIKAHGAVFYAKGAGKNVIDLLGCRGIHIQGLDIVGDETDSPKCGILTGNISGGVTGNHYFEGVRVYGHWSKAAHWSIGGETTNHNGTWYVNEKVDTSVYAFLGDSCNRFGAASDHQTIRAADTAVSYTNQSFTNNCRIETANGGGVPMYLEGSAGWEVEPNTYILGWGAAAIRIRCGATQRTSSLNVGALFETTLGNGLDSVLDLQVPTGGSESLETADFHFATPHASASLIKLSDPAGGTPGTLKLRNVNITVAGVAGGLGDVPLFDNGGGTLSMVGIIRHKNAASINLDELSSFRGEIFTDIATNIPAHNLNGFTIYDESGRYDGGKITRATAKVTISTAELLALNGTPKTLVAAPGAGKFVVPTRFAAFMDYNSVAYDGITAGEDMAFRYTNGSGTILAQIEAIGFLDQASDQHRVAFPSNATTAFIELTPTLNAALVAHMTGGNIATGNSPVHVFVDYMIVDTN